MKQLRLKSLLFILAVVNVTLSAVLIHHAETTAAGTAEVYSRIRKKESELYDVTSLDNALLALTNKDARKNPNILKLTGSILDTLKRNSLDTISCRTTSTEEKKKIYLKAEGTTRNIVKCIFELSVSSSPLQITYLLINTGMENGKTGLAMEVTDGNN